MYTTPVINIKTGKRIFNNLIEYPLPHTVDVQDYVFYIFSDPNDDYKVNAELFFKKYYSKHKAKNVGSLEELIEYLYLEVQSKPIEQIREIVIVCHGNPLDLVVPITKNALSSTEENKKKYRIIRSSTLANLQLAFFDPNSGPEIKSFIAKRRKVVEKLLATSRITVRACRWGQSHEGLYALFSFFGGRANVYAPTLYQYFSDKTPIDGNSRFQNRADVHQHLLKQGFAKRTWKSSERTKEAYINKILEPYKGKEEFVLSKYSFKNGVIVDGSKEIHDLIVNSFNNEEINLELIGHIFSNQELPLSNDLILSRKKTNKKWVLYEEAYEIAGSMFKMRYEILNKYSLHEDEQGYDMELIVFPFLEHRNAKANFSYQFFFGEIENDQFIGKLFDLASFIRDENVVDEEGRTIYSNFVNLLDTQNLTVGNEIYLKFEEHGILLDLPVINVIESGKEWKINDKNATFEIKEFVSYTLPKGLKRSLRVTKSMLKEDLENVVDNLYGVSPNTPGTELMAYLDNYSREELLDVMHFLRNPYQKEYAFYIHEVQQAITRKFDDEEWFAYMVLKDNDLKNKTLHFPIWNTLNSIENEDYRIHAYQGNERLWKEAKASSKKEKFEIDLFEEKRLPYEPEEIPEEVSVDSPSIKTNLPRRKPLPPSKFFDKDRVYVNEPLEDINCQKFKIAIDLLVVNFGKGREEIEKIFKETKITTSSTLYDYMSSEGYWNSIELAFNLLEVFTPSVHSPNILIRGLAELLESKVGFVFGLYVMYKSVESFLVIDYAEPMKDGWKKSKRNGMITGLKYGAEMINQIIKANQVNGTPIKDSYELFETALPARDAHLYFFNKPDKYFDIMFQNWKTGYEEGYKSGIDVVNSNLNNILNNYWKIFRQYATQRGITDCQLKILLQSRLLDDHKVKMMIMTVLVKSLYTVDYKASDFKFEPLGQSN